MDASINLLDVVAGECRCIIALSEAHRSSHWRTRIKWKWQYLGAHFNCPARFYRQFNRASLPYKCRLFKWFTCKSLLSIPSVPQLSITRKATCKNPCKVPVGVALLQLPYKNPDCAWGVSGWGWKLTRKMERVVCENLLRPCISGKQSGGDTERSTAAPRQWAQICKQPMSSPAQIYLRGEHYRFLFSICGCTIMFLSSLLVGLLRLFLPVNEIQDHYQIVQPLDRGNIVFFIFPYIYYTYCFIRRRCKLLGIVFIFAKRQIMFFFFSYCFPILHLVLNTVEEC